MSEVDLKGRKVIVHDMCLRDGMHAKREQMSIEQMVSIATALDAAGVPYIQATHGAGLGGHGLALLHQLSLGHQLLGAAGAEVHAQLGADHHQKSAS